MEMIEQLGFSSSPLLTAVLVFFLVLVFAEVLALYLHVAGFGRVEVSLLVALPLLGYLSALPLVSGPVGGFDTGLFGTVFATARVFDVPVLHVNNSVIGFNLIGFSIPVVITLKMLVERRVPGKQFCLVGAITAGVTYLYTTTEPGRGVVVYFLAIPPILAAAIAFMLRKMKRAGDFNPALLAYAGATIGVLVGADLLNLYRLAAHRWDAPVFISIGGGSVLDAIFLAGIVALFADLVFRSQEENLLRPLVNLFRGGGRR